MPTPTIPAGNLFMNATTYTGTGATLSVTNGTPGASFQPDFVWIKNRTVAWDNILVNSVVGVGYNLVSNSTGAEVASGYVSSANSNGFTVGADPRVNGSTNALVGWQWKAGGTAVSNTSGTITSQVSANTTSGFSVVTYTGTGAVGATVGHGLGVAPKMIIQKTRSNGTSDDNWHVYHASIGNTGALSLNTTSATSTSAVWWNNTSPTSSVFTIGGSGAAGYTNNSGSTYVTYCWSEVAGYSAFGSYTGNGSTDGPFVYLGFRPRFLLLKSSSAAGTNWVLTDSSRNTYNVVDGLLFPNLSDAETIVTECDFLSNGFKIRGTVSGINGSGSTYIYAAFAENPFKYANAR
jgi:hypothetical protein